MTGHRELPAFAAVLAALLGAFLGETLVGGKILSPADVLLATKSFEEFRGPGYVPANRLLIDPVLQFQPWLEFNRMMLRSGRLPLWNHLAGCGTPHLANGQAAVFDPFHLIAYLGTLPLAFAWMAAARLWVAGLGMFLLARRWDLGPWARWFAGLSFPFCGFLIAWLLFPVTSVAVWMPWLLLATDAALDRPGPRSLGLLALAVAATMLGGHVQTSAHVLMAAGGYAIWRLRARCRPSRPDGSRGVRGRLLTLAGGVGLGLAIAAIEIIPLGFYLARSPVWADRRADRTPVTAIERPRTLDALCTAFPYAFGSQRRGHPNLAKAMGVHNLNESAGGFAGLATLLWLAPLGATASRETPRARFLAGLVVLGGMGAFGIPPVANLLRAAPVLDVMDHRRLSLWVAFGLVLLGGIGLDRLVSALPGRGWAAWTCLWVVGALGLGIGAGLVGRAEPRLREKALAHYATAAAATPGADPEAFRKRALSQVRQTLTFVPRYALIGSAHLLTLAVLVACWRRRWLPPVALRGSLLTLTMLDLIGFGLGLNPAISPADARTEGAVIAYLRHEAAPPLRILALGAELVPNTLMRHGLADIRNYDSIELSRSLDAFAPLYEPGGSRTSRREITWGGVGRSLDRLRAARVAAVVASDPPPANLCTRVDRVGSVWVARLDAGPPDRTADDHGIIHVTMPAQKDGIIPIFETYDPGWRAEVDGHPVPVEIHEGAYLAVAVAPGARRLVLRYDPPEVKAALVVTAVALAATVLCLSEFKPAGYGRKRG